MRVLLAQLAPAPGAVDRNVERLAHVVRSAREAELAVFPELYLSGYDLSAARGLALVPADPPLRKVAAVAAETRTAIVVGFPERLDGGRAANAAACFDADGRLAAVYRKTHLFGAAEREAFVAGDTLVVTQLAGVAVAPLVCFDVEFPEPARAAARAGAELLVTLAANMAPYAPDHALAARARALDNRIPHVYVNRVGAEAGLTFVGGSVAVRADGVVVARAGEQEGVAGAELDPGAPASGDTDYLSHVRSDLPVEVLTAVLQGGGPR
jgi:predicted amidohydrolase